MLPSWRPGGFSVTFFCGAEILYLGLLFPRLCFLFSASSLGPSSSFSLSVIRAPLWCLHSCLRLDVTCHPFPLLLCAVPPPPPLPWLCWLSFHRFQLSLFVSRGAVRPVRTSSERVGVRKFLVHLLERVVLLASPVHRSHFWVSPLPDFCCLLFLGFTSLSACRILWGRSSFFPLSSSLFCSSSLYYLLSSPLAKPSAILLASRSTAGCLLRELRPIFCLSNTLHHPSPSSVWPWA